MTLNQTIQRIDNIVDHLLVSFAENPASRFLITLPPLVDGIETLPILDCQEYNYCMAQFREVITYKYLLNALKSKQLSVNRDTLATCLRNLRKSPFIDYYDLGDYHEYAFYYYKKLGDEKKAKRHLLSCYMNRGRAILSAGKTFDCKELILCLMKDHKRMQAFLIYVISFIHYDFEEVQDFMKRSQYLLLERAMVLAVKLFAENAAYNVNERSCIYYVQSLYYEKTGRGDLAQSAREAYKKLGGDKNYDLDLVNFMITQPDPHLADERFLDYMLYAESIEENDIYPIDEDGNINLEEEEDDPIVQKDGRSNFMDTYYRPMRGTFAFKRLYDQAENGNESALRELVHRYREGDGVTPCDCAAVAWEKQLNRRK